MSSDNTFVATTEACTMIAVIRLFVPHGVSAIQAIHNRPMSLADKIAITGDTRPSTVIYLSRQAQLTAADVRIIAPLFFSHREDVVGAIAANAVMTREAYEIITRLRWVRIDPYLRRLYANDSIVGSGAGAADFNGSLANSRAHFIAHIDGMLTPLPAVDTVDKDEVTEYARYSTTPSSVLDLAFRQKYPWMSKECTPTRNQMWVMADYNKRWLRPFDDVEMDIAYQRDDSLLQLSHEGRCQHYLYRLHDYEHYYRVVLLRAIRILARDLVSQLAVDGGYAYHLRAADVGGY